MSSDLENTLTLRSYRVFRSSLMMVLIGGALLRMGGSMTRFVCDRTDDHCKIVRERLLQQDAKQVLPLNRIQSARVARRQSDNNDLYQAVFETDAGTINLSRASSSWRYLGTLAPGASRS